MWSKDWLDALVVVVWISLWAGLVYALPFARI